MHAPSPDTPDALALRKRRTRQAVRRAILALDPDDRRERDRRIVATAGALIETRLRPRAAGGPPVVFGYLPLPDEVDLRPLLHRLRERGVTLALPRMEDGGQLTMFQALDLEAGLEDHPYGLRQPKKYFPRIPAAAACVILTPGRAFSAEGARLGRGKGYYDRFLAETRGWRVALAYECQVLDAVPAGEHDLRVDVIVTEARVLRASPAGA